MWAARSLRWDLWPGESSSWTRQSIMVLRLSGRALSRVCVCHCGCLKAIMSIWMALLRRSENDGRWQGRHTQQTALEGWVWLLKMCVETCIFIIICAGYLCTAPSCVYPLTCLSVRAGHCGWIDCPLSACHSRHNDTWWKPLCGFGHLWNLVAVGCMT